MRWITLFALLASPLLATQAAESAAAAAPAVEEPEPQLEGVVMERPGGGFITLTMEGPKAVLKFFDAKKKPVAPDVVRALVKFRPSGRRPENRTLLLSDDGMSLTHGRPLRPPFVFKAYISLVTDTGAADVADEDESGEVVSTEQYQVSYP